METENPSTFDGALKALDQVGEVDVARVQKALVSTQETVSEYVDSLAELKAKTKALKENTIGRVKELWEKHPEIFLIGGLSAILFIARARRKKKTNGKR